MVGREMKHNIWYTGALISMLAGMLVATGIENAASDAIMMRNFLISLALTVGAILLMRYGQHVEVLAERKERRRMRRAQEESRL